MVYIKKPSPRARFGSQYQQNSPSKDTNQQALCSREIHSRSTPASPMDQPPWFRAPHTCGSHLLRAQRLAWRFTGSRARSSSSPRLPRRRIHVLRRFEDGALLSRYQRGNLRGCGRNTCRDRTPAVFNARNSTSFAAIRARAQHFQKINFLARRAFGLFVWGTQAEK